MRTSQQEKELFNKSVAIAVQAFLNGTLQRMDCKACFVGNLISGNGYKFGRMAHWPKLTCELFANDSIYDTETAKKEVSVSGFTAKELRLIEKAFMTGSIDNDIFSEAKNFDGLMASVETMAEILHIDLTAKEEAKKLFVKA